MNSLQYKRESPVGHYRSDWDNDVILYDFFKVNDRFLRDNYSCVYMIGDFYIGTTSGLRKRVLSHFKEVAKGVHANRRFSSKMLELINAGKSAPLTVLYKSRCRHKEDELIHQYLSDGFPLTNVVMTSIKTSLNDSICCLIDKYTYLGADSVPVSMIIDDLLAIKRTSE